MHTIETKFTLFARGHLYWGSTYIKIIQCVIPLTYEGGAKDDYFIFIIQVLAIQNEDQADTCT